MPRRVPRLRTDEEVEAFLEQDLSDLDFSQFEPIRFEIEPKSAQQSPLDAGKAGPRQSS